MHIKYGDKRPKGHLCNLHNEMVEAAESRINTECSLTMREGVSKQREHAPRKPEFPHYA